MHHKNLNVTRKHLCYVPTLSEYGLASHLNCNQRYSLKQNHL